MYLVYIDDQLVYSTDMADESTVIEAPKLSLEINNSGQFEFTIYPQHYMYDYIYKMKSIVQVLWDNVEVFYGRVLEVQVSTYRDKHVTCEGALAFLNDSVQPPLKKNSKYTVQELVTNILDTHNSQVDEDIKRFYVGNITVGDDKSYEFERTSHQDSRSSIENIMELLDGYLKVRRVDGKLYLDLLKDYDPAVNQSIEFGVNLATIQVNDEAEDLFTAIYPVGKNNLTIPENQGGPWLEDEEMVQKYGRIIRAVSFDNVTKVADLIQNGIEYLQKNGANVPYRYDIGAIDLHYFDPQKDLLLPGSTVPIKSELHDCDEDELICLSCELDIQNPENNNYIIGVPDPFGGTGAKGITNGSTSLSTSVARGNRSTSASLLDLEQNYDELDIYAKEMRAHVDEFEVFSLNSFDSFNIFRDSVRGSDLWLNRNEIVGLSGDLKKGDDGHLHVKNGTKLLLDRDQASLEVYSDENLTAGVIVSKVNNGSVMINANKVTIDAGTTLELLAGDYERQKSWFTEKINGIEASAIWLNRDHIDEVAGEWTKDPAGLHLINGSHLYIGEGSASMNVYDEANLTAKVVVDKINDGTATIEGNHINLTANSSFNLKVGKDEVISSINASTEGVTISGDKLDLTANSEFNLKVGKGEIASSINATDQSVKISASKINLAGYVTAEDLSATNARINNVLSGTTAATHLHTAAFTVTGSSFSLGGSAYTSATRQYVSSLTVKTVSIQDSVTGQVTTFKAVDSFTTSGATFLVRLNS